VVLGASQPRHAHALEQVVFVHEVEGLGGGQVEVELVLVLLDVDLGLRLELEQDEGEVEFLLGRRPATRLRGLQLVLVDDAVERDVLLLELVEELELVVVDEALVPDLVDLLQALGSQLLHA